MEKKERYTVEYILPLIEQGKTFDLDGDLIRMGTLRMRNFKVHGTTCVRCGLVGAYFDKERNPKSHEFHLNLYALKGEREILMTKDHIISLAMGGPNQMENLQTMCAPCNNKKGDGRKELKKAGPPGGGEFIIPLRSYSKPLRKTLTHIRDLVAAGTIQVSDLDCLITSLNKVLCRGIQTHSMHDVPTGMEIQEYDPHNTVFIPVGESAVIVTGGAADDNFYIFNKRTRERLLISMKKG